MSSWQLAHLAGAIPAGDYQRISAPETSRWQVQPIILHGDALVLIAHDTHHALPTLTVKAGMIIEQACHEGLHLQLGITVTFERLLYVRLSDWHTPTVIFHPMGRITAGEPRAECIALDQLTHATHSTITPTDIAYRLQQDLHTPPTRAIYLGTGDQVKDRS
ncbi:MAG: hypothetical protein ACFE0Q_07130 [Anaerolineae bacterium]